MRREGENNLDSAFPAVSVPAAQNPFPISVPACPRTDGEIDPVLRPAELPAQADSAAAADSAAEWKSMMAIALTSEALALPDVRLDKIAIVQSALANGSYNIGASELASKVIDSMVESMKKLDG